MSAVPASIPKAAAAQAVNTVVVSGRCMKVKKAGAVFIHQVVIPAEDRFSAPTWVEFTASKRLASVEEDVQQLCRLGGYRRQAKVNDRDTGEIRNEQFVDVRLRAIEGAE